MPRPVAKFIEPIEAPYEEIIAQLIGGEAQEELHNFPKFFPRSPLRYPGGKNRAIKSIYNYIPDTVTKLCSPFLGGASIELACSTRMEVFGSDVFEPLVDFWQELLENPDELVKRVQSYYPLSKTTFYNLQKRYMTLTDKRERAAAFFVLNRSSFSGSTLSGGMSPDHPRFNPSAINRLATFHADNFHVECLDFRDAISRHSDAFLYLDPPYLNRQALYGVNGDTHKGFDHKALAEILHERGNWIMSYNESDEIRRLYHGYPIFLVEWTYGMSKNKQSSEVLVFSKDLVP